MLTIIIKDGLNIHQIDENTFEITNEPSDVLFVESEHVTITREIYGIQN